MFRCGWHLIQKVPYNAINIEYLASKRFQRPFGYIYKNIPFQTSYCFNSTNIISKLRQLKIMSTKQEKQLRLKEMTLANKSRRDERNKKKCPSTLCYLQVLGSGAPGAPRALYVSTDGESYLFNCGEGTQRLAAENKIKMISVENMLFTHKSWRNVGGLPGMLLTQQVAAAPDMRLHGPPGIHMLYRETRDFLKFHSIQLSYRHYAEENGTFGSKGDPMVIKVVPIRPTDREPSSAEAAPPQPEVLDYAIVNGSKTEADDRGSKRPNSAEEESPASKRAMSDEFTTDMAMAYICVMSPKFGRLDINLCVKKGVTTGPQLGKLKAGEDIDVVGEDGVLKVVRAADVTKPDDPGPVFVVVEAPTKGHLNALVQHPAFAPHQTSDSLRAEDVPQAVVHFTPAHIIRDPLYQAWVGKFPEETTHILINEENSCMGSEAVHRIQAKLHYLDPKAFPLLADDSIPDAATRSDSAEGAFGLSDRFRYEDEIVSDSVLLPAAGKCLRGYTGLAYFLRPRHRLSKSMCPSFNRVAIDKEIVESGCVQRFLPVPPEDKLFPRITFLGTCSCIPYKTRNTSGILLQVESDSYLLLDCGEGTYGQLVRNMGPVRAADVLSKLRAVYVSHHHADHHLGLINVLLHRRKALQDRSMDVTPLLLLAPTNMISYLNYYHQMFEAINDDYTYVDNLHFLPNRTSLPKEECQKVFDQMRIKKMETCRVLHCQNACGVAITTSNDKKIVYSGDTRPCYDLVKLGINCDILIHEATLEDSLQREASIKMHCTVTDAVQISKQMAAKHTLLTHFSLRYKVPLLPDEEEGALQTVSVAFDNMTVDESDLPRLSLLYEDLEKMFAQEVGEMRFETEKKKFNVERVEAMRAREAAAAVATQN